MRRITAALFLLIASYTGVAIGAIRTHSIDAGGSPASNSNYQLRFQAVGQSSGGISFITDRSVQSGFGIETITVGSIVLSPAVTDGTLTFVSRNVRVQVNFDPGFNSRKIQLQVSRNAVLNPNPAVTYFGAGGGNQPLYATWNSVAEIAVTGTVQFLARGLDGLAWGPWFTSPQSWVVDNENPVANTINIYPPIISPTNPTSVGVHDTLGVTFNVVDSYPREWRLNILDGSTVMRAYTELTSTAGIKAVTWDGKDFNGQYVHDGTYDLQLVLVDQAGNVATFNAGSTIVYDGMPDIIDIGTSVDPFSPAISPGIKDTTNVLFTFVSPYAATWSVEFVPTPGPQVSIRTITGAGGGALSVLWDGKNQANDNIATGYYIYRITVTDQAGNTTTNAEHTVFVDNTPPQIVGFNTIPPEIHGTEDIDFTYNLSLHKSDTYSTGNNLIWVARNYIPGEPNNPNTDNPPVIKAAYMEPGNNDTLMVFLEPHANTATGDRAFIQLGLHDQAGNSVTTDVEMIIAAVNDVPVWKAVIVGSEFQKDGNTYIYNVKMNENTTNNEIILDNFVFDPDNDYADLVYTVSQNVHVSASVGAATLGHPLILVPERYWYGDEAITINVADTQTPPALISRQRVIVRVWPVNYPPIISSEYPDVVSAPEDEVLFLTPTQNLTYYKDDNFMEDQKPTYSSQLIWTVVTASVDQTFVSTFNYSPTQDRFLFTPVAHKFGTTNVTVVLTDTDEVPRQVFPTYVPNPLSVTRSVTLVWNSVNDVPVITTPIPNLSGNEDDPAFTLNLFNSFSDVETPVVDMTLTAAASTTNFLTIAVTQPTKVVTLTPVTHAWGTANVLFTISDPDGGSATQSIIVTLNAVNQIPTLSGISISSAFGVLGPQRKVRYSDTITITAEGYSDVGYPFEAVGDEYRPSTNLALNFVQNSPFYNYVWSVNAVPTRSVSNATSNIDVLSFNDSALQGATITFEVRPRDIFATGNIGLPVTTSFVVNAVPPTANPLSPADGTQFTTRNISLQWSVVTDTDTDLIYYRAKVWRVDTAGSPSPSISITDDDFYYDSGWLPTFNAVTSQNATFVDGFYYWTVYTANQFDNGAMDFQDSGWYRTYSVDIDEGNFGTQNVTPSDSVRVTDNVVAGNFNVFFGTKLPTASIFVEVTNQAPNGTITVMAEQVATPDGFSQWSYFAQYPLGRTRYSFYSNGIRFYLLDVENFTLTNPPTITNTNMTRDSNGIYQAISSADTFEITGTKDINTSIWYEHNGNNVMQVASSNETTFAFTITADEPSGFVTAQNPRAVASSKVTVNVQFLVGSPTASVTVTPDRVNLIENLSALSESEQQRLSHGGVHWSSLRNIASYALKLGGTTLLNGSVSANQLVDLSVTASALNEGINTLNLVLVDIAGNTGTQNVTLNRISTPPTVNISAKMINKPGRTLTLFFTFNPAAGEPTRSLTLSARVNSDAFSTTNVSTVNSTTWLYSNSNYDYDTSTFTIRAIDDLFNVYVRTYDTAALDAADWDVIADLVLSHGLLPSSVDRLYTDWVDLTSGRPQGLSALAITPESLQNAFEKPEGDLNFPEPLRRTMFRLYGKDKMGTILPDLDLTRANVQMVFAFPDSVKVEPSALVPVLWDPLQQQWGRLDVPFERVKNSRYLIVTVPQGGLWALAEYRPVATSLAQVRVYPNPWNPSDNDPNNGDETGIQFDNVMDQSDIKIYTISGRLVRHGVSSGATWIWDGNNDAGRPVASGVYLYIITNGSELKRGRITVIR